MYLSPDVVIMTKRELEEAKAAAFQAGMRRGRGERAADAEEYRGPLADLGCGVKGGVSAPEVWR